MWDTLGAVNFAPFLGWAGRCWVLLSSHTVLLGQNPSDRVSHVASAGFEFMILLPQPPNSAELQTCATTFDFSFLIIVFSVVSAYIGQLSYC